MPLWAATGHLGDSVISAGLSQTWAQLTNLWLDGLASHPAASLASMFLQSLLRSERGSRKVPVLFQTKSHGHAQGHRAKSVNSRRQLVGTTNLTAPYLTSQTGPHTWCLGKAWMGLGA